MKTETEIKAMEKYIERNLRDSKIDNEHRNRLRNELEVIKWVLGTSGIPEHEEVVPKK